MASGRLPGGPYPPIEISDTKQPEHGDFACNFALVASKQSGLNPRQIGEMLRDALIAGPAGVFAGVEVAGPGFVNLRLDPNWVASFVGEILKRGDRLATSVQPQQSQRINVEFVSVNPNGPITIGSGRGAAYGSTLANVLQAAGNVVHREFYINDGTSSEQMRLFAESVRAIIEGHPVPDNGYKGDYVADAAHNIVNEHPDCAGSSTDWFQVEAQTAMLSRQRSDLETFGVEFDTWFSEQSLHDSGKVKTCLEHLVDNGAADERPLRTKLKLAKGGKIDEVIIEDQEAANDDEDAKDDNGVLPTLWLRSTKFGDDMDRVLRRKDGRLTYISSDVAYHQDKFNRPPDADRLITILGPDHHGYIGRLQAVLAAQLLQANIEEAGGEPLSDTEAQLYGSAAERDACHRALAEAREKLEVQIYQLVRFLKDGKPAPMRKRDGNIYALIDLIDEIGRKVKPNDSRDEQHKVGKDVARFFYLMRSHDTTFDFDLDLAERQSDENPVFYVQYAHARICSVLRKAEGIELAGDTVDTLSHPKELELIKKIADLSYEVERCAEDYGVHRLTTFAIELARTYHHFYDACRVIQEDQPSLTRARLQLCEAAKLGFQAVFSLLGIEAPERMEREAPMAPVS